MDGAAALRRTIAAHPDADLPRLVYADWLEDRGDDAQAGFIRGQVELAPARPWAPGRVRDRHFPPAFLARRDWRDGLPEVAPRVAAWHPETPYHRGMPDWLVVRDLASFLDDAPRLFAEAPIGKLSLPTATLDVWRQFFRQRWLARVHAIHFYGVTTPIEPLRLLTQTGDASGLHELVLEWAGGVSMPLLLTDLFRSEAGRRLRRLELRVGGDGTGEWVEAFEGVGTGHALADLKLVTMQTGRDGLRRLVEQPLINQLNTLHLVNGRIPKNALRPLLHANVSPYLEDVAFVNAVGADHVARLLGTAGRLNQIQRLDLSGHQLQELPKWSESRGLDRIKSLSVRQAMLRPAAIEQVVAAQFWPRLVELDLSGNRLDPEAVEALIRAESQPDLAAIVLSGRDLSPPTVEALRERFGESLLLTETT